jgi:hypothetical protein
MQQPGAGRLHPSPRRDPRPHLREPTTPRFGPEPPRHRNHPVEHALPCARHCRAPPGRGCPGPAPRSLACKGHDALRVGLSGLFDRFPRLRIILGHLGEGLPFLSPRVEHRAQPCQPGGAGTAGQAGYFLPARELLCDHRRHFRTQALLDTAPRVKAGSTPIFGRLPLRNGAGADRLV